MPRNVGDGSEGDIDHPALIGWYPDLLRCLTCWGAMRRRKLIGLLGVATTAWPFSVGAQQRSMPVVGWLNAGGFGASTAYVASFRRGLGEIGYVEGQNVAVEYRWADDQYDR